MTNQTQVRDAMTADVVTVLPNDTLTEAALRLSRHRIGGMPVVGPRRAIVGVISESDIIQALLPPDELSRSMTLLDFVTQHRGQAPAKHAPLFVEDVMSQAVATVGPAEVLWSAASLMHRRGIKRLPVVDDDGRLVGMLTRGDVIRAIVCEAPSPVS